MWPSTFNKKSATISGWQALGDFASVKQQLQKIRASTRISSSKKSHGDGQMYSQGGARPLPPLPPGGGCQAQSSNKSVRFSLPQGGGGGVFLQGSEGSGSDQGYESDQSRVRQSLLLADFNASIVNSQERRMRMEQPGLLSKLTNFRHKISETEGGHHLHYGQSSTLTRSGGHGGTLTRYGHKESDHLYYGPVKNIGESDRDMSSSSPVLLEMYDHVKVHPDGTRKKDQKSMKAAMARLASSENLSSSYDIVLGLVRRPPPPPSPRPSCRHAQASPPPAPRHRHCHCHAHHQCNSSRERNNFSTRERDSSSRRSQHSRSRPSSPSPAPRARSRSRPSSPTQTLEKPAKSKWLFGKKAKRSASADRERSRGPHAPLGPVALGWDDSRPQALGQWEDTGNIGWERPERRESQETASSDTEAAANTAQLAGDLCRRATALRRTLYRLPGLINSRTDFLEIIKDVASEMKLLLDAAGRLGPALPDQQRAELDLARRKLLETSRSFSTALKKYFKTPEATPVLLAATALVYRTDEIIQALEP